MSKDLFSSQSELYARYRPRYPAELIEYILQFVINRDAAWDCATGNGQAAYLLAEHFKSVKATDISDKQLASSIQHPRIQYSVATAEDSPFADGSFDLITVAQAYHWFNFDAFEKEARRVLKPTGILSVWGYGLVNSTMDSLNTIIKSFYTNVVGPYWDVERKYVDEQYETIPFPYDHIARANFSFYQDWSVEDLLGYMNTWSSVQHFIAKKGFNPVHRLKGQISEIWPSRNTLPFRFPLFLRIGRIRGK